MGCNHNYRSAGIVTLTVLLSFAARPCFAGEKEELISRRDTYTYVLCYYEDALDYTIENLHSKNINSRKFAMDIASRILLLRLRGDNPSKEIQLFAAFQKTDAFACSWKPGKQTGSNLENQTYPPGFA